MKPDLSFAGFFNSLRSLLKLRNFIFLLAIFSSLVLYYLLSDYYQPFKNASSYWKSKDEVYTFYAGSEGGFYHKIGTEVRNLNGVYNEVEQDGIRIHVAEPTSGGLDNAVKVLSTKNSFGLIQESTLTANDELRNKINYVSPLYMERLHIICKKKLFGEGVNLNDVRELTDSSDTLTKTLFNKDRTVSIGEVGSGTRVVASYLMELLDVSPKIYGISQKDGLEALKNDSIDVYMVIVGAPLERYSELLGKDSEYMLIGISPTLIVEINDKFSTNYRVSNFKSKYPDYSHINTLGSYSYLISSTDVDERMNIEMLKLIAFISPTIKKNLELKSWKKRKFQLDEINFESGVEARETDLKVEVYKSMTLIIISIVASTFFAVWIFIWVISSIKLARYFRKVTRVYQLSFPEAVDIDTNISSVFMGKLPENGTYHINELVKGINALRRLKTEVRKDYDTGGISESHFRNLLSSMQTALLEFRTTLTRRITNEIKYNESSKAYINEKTLTNYYSSAYINQDQYTMLLNALTQKKN